MIEGNAEGIGISRINYKSLKYKTKRMNTYITRAVTYQETSKVGENIGLNSL